MVLTAATLGSYYFAHIYPQSRDFWIGLSGGFITTIVTVFFVDYLIEQSHSMRWQEVRQVAREDLLVFSNGLVTYFASPMGIDVIGFIREYPAAELKPADIVSWFLHEMTNQPALSLFEWMDTAEWKNLDTSLRVIKHDLMEKISLYREALPPEVLGKLLAVHQAFAAFYDTYSFVPAYFTQPASQWPAHQDGAEGNRRVRHVVLQSMVGSFDKYIATVKAFRVELERFGK